MAATAARRTTTTRTEVVERPRDGGAMCKANECCSPFNGKLPAGGVHVPVSSFKA